MQGRAPSLLLLYAYVQHVVPADKGVPVLVPQLSVHVLLCLLQSDVHVPVQAHQNTPVVRTGVQFHQNWLAGYLLEEIARCLFLTHLTSTKTVDDEIVELDTGSKQAVIYSIVLTTSIHRQVKFKPNSSACPVTIREAMLCPGRP